jgi:hypothetical protein
LEGADDEHPEDIEHPTIATAIVKPFEIIEAIASDGAAVTIDVADARAAVSTLLSPAPSSTTIPLPLPLPPLRHR